MDKIKTVLTKYWFIAPILGLILLFVVYKMPRNVRKNVLKF
jgi:hypothetical protein